MPDREARDPFTGEPILLHAPHSVEVLNGDRVVGRFLWNDNEIIVRGDSDLVSLLATLAANTLGALFHTASDDDVLMPPGPLAPIAEHLAYLAKTRGRST